MKIAILGKRGISNTYGGPETHAELLSPIFLRLKHEVTVYSPDEHPYQNGQWQGIRIKHVFNRESRLRIWGTLIYDYLCLRDACRADYDIILDGLQHPELFSNSVLVPEDPDPPYKWIPVMLDPPEHTKWRQLLAAWFSPRRFDKMAD